MSGKAAKSLVESGGPAAVGPSFITTTTLLEGLADAQNHAAWNGFVGRYRPVVVGYARRLGIPAADAEDVAQMVLGEFARGYIAGAYVRNRGRLRGWLFGIARNQVMLWRRKNAGAGPAGGAAGELGVEDVELARMWEREWEEHVLRRSLELLRELVTVQTLEAFVMFVMDGHPAEVVAGRLGMTANAVFGAKRRVLERLRAVREQVEAET